MGMLIGGVFLALANAIDIAWSVPWPAGGLTIRIWHHFFDALITLSACAWWALPFALAARWPVLSRERAHWGWLGLTALTTVAMYFVLERHIIRQGHAAIEGIPFILVPGYTLLAGLSVPAGFYVAGFLVRVRYGWALGAIAAAVAVVVGHVIMRDDYPGVHTAILWVAGGAGGACFAPAGLRWMRKREGRATWLFAVAAVVAVVGALWHPPNPVRVALFRQPGAVAAWAMSRTLWSPPPVDATRPPPTEHRDPEPLLDASLVGVAERPMVVVMTVDALRADVVADPELEHRFPQITALKKSGVAFSRAVACGSQTSVSLTSMFASRYFSQMRWAKHGHGRMRFYYAAEDPSVRFPSLLGDAGIATESFVPIIFLSDSFGIVRGFEKETCVVEDRRHAAAREVMEPLLARLKAHDPNEPGFFYVHVMEPHEPYNRGAVRDGSDWENYLSEVEIVDRWVGKLWQLMRRRFRRNGYIILSADHGEAFGEHGTSSIPKRSTTSSFACPSSRGVRACPRGGSTPG